MKHGNWEFGVKEMIRLLVQSGCDPNAREFRYGLTPLLMAETVQVAAALGEAGADTGASDCFGHAADRWLPKHLMDAALARFPPSPAATASEIVVMVCGEAGIPSLPWPASGIASQVIQCCAHVEDRMSGGSLPEPWWTSTVCSRTLPVECFPAVRTLLETRRGGFARPSSTAIARLCDSALFSRRALAELGKEENRRILLLAVLPSDRQETIPSLQAKVQQLRESLPRAILGVVAIGSKRTQQDSAVPLSRDDLTKAAQGMNASVYGECESSSGKSFGEALRWLVEFSLVDHAVPAKDREPFYRELATQWDETVVREVPPVVLFQDAIRRSVRIVLVGHRMSGKTCLLDFLRDPTRKQDVAPVPTMGIDEAQLDIEKDISVTAFDFSSQFLFVFLSIFLFLSNDPFFSRAGISESPSIFCEIPLIRISRPPKKSLPTRSLSEDHWRTRL